VRRLVSTLARAGVSLLVGLLVLAVLRWPPVWARPLVDVRAFTRNGAPVSDPKNVVVAIGDTVVFRVFADVTGLNDSKPDCFQALSGSFLSTGGIKGNLALSFSGFAQPFTANATSAGQQTVVPTGLQLGLGTRASSNEVIFTQGTFASTGNPCGAPASTTTSSPRCTCTTTSPRPSPV